MHDQREPAENGGGDEHDQQVGIDATEAPFVEVDEAEAAGLDPPGDQRGDEKAGNHEEHVDADEAAGKLAHVEVEQDDDGDRQRPQSIDIGAILNRRL